MHNITSIVETRLSGKADRSTFGPCYTGPCPWCGGTDRFHVYPVGGEDIPGIGNLGRFHCMDGNQGRAGCGRKGDMISYVQQRKGKDFESACQELGINPQSILNYRRAQKGLPPEQRRAPEHHTLALSEASEQWRTNAKELARYASSQLADSVALEYLRSRGLQDCRMKDAVLGFYPHYKRADARLWGAKSGTMLIPRGIVIPWFDDDNQVLCLRFRRLPQDESDQAREFYGVNKDGSISRYKVLSGSSSQYLYRGELLTPDCDAALFEGEIDALIASQVADSSCICLATGSTGWGRNDRNLRKLAVCSQVLVCFDNDQNQAGDRAATYWTDSLANARRWRPLWSDASDMARDGVDLQAWLAIGLQPLTEHIETPECCADCETPISADDREFYYVPINETEALCYCSRCRDETGQLLLLPQETPIAPAVDQAQPSADSLTAIVEQMVQECPGLQLHEVFPAAEVEQVKARVLREYQERRRREEDERQAQQEAIMAARRKRWVA